MVKAVFLVQWFAATRLIRLDLPVQRKLKLRAKHGVLVDFIDFLKSMLIAFEPIIFVSYC
ncbi:hypothetical protein BBD42_24835 [Paenibacillus sp. BIHB 4019]|uniref:Uncharacterized protein n=1 Tax=Paenibacillus sp. BIHB 4019 TaxID=1870819 RepID=A0A1B2DNQ6_9BACL|nr:hypothetical protein BBD42_24835 [Paenibacillus sp. BIHB 4019]